MVVVDALTERAVKRIFGAFDAQRVCIYQISLCR